MATAKKVAKEEVRPVKFLEKTVGTGFNGDAVTFTLGNGQELRASLANMPQTIQTQLALHGLSQKVGDAAAGCAGDKAYGAAYSAMADVIENLQAGKWNAGRESNGGDLAIAIANLKGLELADVQAAVRQATEEQRKAWMKNKAINAEVLRIRAERAAQVADSEDDFDFEV